MNVHLKKYSYQIPWVILVTSLLLIGCMIAFSIYDDQRRIMKEEQNELTAQTKVIEENLSAQLKGVYQTLDSIRKDRHILKDANNVRLSNYQLVVLSRAIPGIRTLLITDAKGKVTASNRPQLIGQDLSFRNFFKVPLNSGNLSTFYISPPFMSILGQFVINITLIIPDAKGGFNGVISAGLDHTYFKTLLSSVVYAPDMQSALAHGDGEQFLMIPEIAGMAGLNLNMPGSFFTRHIASGSNFNLLTGSATATGEYRLTALRTVLPADLHMDKPLVVLVSRDMTALHAGWRLNAYAKGAFFILVVVGAILVLYFYQKRQHKFDAISENYETMLRFDAERFKLATEAAGVGVWDHDLENEQLTWNNVMYSIYGLDPNEFSASFDVWQAAIMPEDLSDTNEALQTALKNGLPFNLIFRIYRKDGELRTIRAMGLVHYNMAGKPIRLIGINEDITERQHDADLLRESERFLKTLTNTIPSMIAYWTSELRCIFANDEHFVWFGKHPEELRGILLPEFLGEKLFNKVRPFVLGALNGEEQHFERAMTRQNGEVGHTWTHYIPDIDNGKVIGFYVLINDITELKRAQIQLQELNLVLKLRTDEAEQANRSKSAFLATVAHEFRTPLSLLTSSIDIMDRYEERLSIVQRTEQASHIRSATRQMSGLIESVLSFSHLEAASPKNVPVEMNVGRFLHNIADEVKSACCNNHEFSILIADNCATVVLDEIHLRRVIENLLTNAFRYTPAGGSVSLEANCDNDTLQVQVIDSGIGIPKDSQKQIFEPFFRCLNVESRRGIGLGLSIVHKTLSLMGGTIVIDSEVGRGTAMRVKIPLAAHSITEDHSCTPF